MATRSKLFSSVADSMCNEIYQNTNTDVRISDLAQLSDRFNLKNGALNTGDEVGLYPAYMWFESQ